MRLNEIISSNQVIITLRNIKIKFLSEYEFINTSHIFFLNARIGKSRHRILHGNIDTLKADIDIFINYDFDPDPDIDLLKSEATEILNKLSKIEKEIP